MATSRIARSPTIVVTLMTESMNHDVADAVPVPLFSAADRDMFLLQQRNARHGHKNPASPQHEKVPPSLGEAPRQHREESRDDGRHHNDQKYIHGAPKKPDRMCKFPVAPTLDNVVVVLSAEAQDRRLVSGLGHRKRGLDMRYAILEPDSFAQSVRLQRLTCGNS